MCANLYSFYYFISERQRYAETDFNFGLHNKIIVLFLSKNNWSKYFTDEFVCSKRKPKSKSYSKSWNKKSPYHGTVYYFPDTITSSGIQNYI